MDWFSVHRYTLGVMIGVIFGLTARLLLLRTDYRQYPTYPHGQIIHISLGIIAAALGAVAVPSLLNKEYTAVTFLGLAAQQFRDVRKMERDTLTIMDELELVQRGGSYIEGIAMVFEGRNYMVIFTAFMASLFSTIFPWYWGIAAGLAALFISHFFKSGKSVSEIADVSEAQLRMDGPDLFVGDIYIMNVGLEDSQKKIAAHGLGLIVTPKNLNCRVTLANLGQRQAILYDLSTIMGVFRDSGEPSLRPLAKLDMEDGRLGVFILPLDPNIEKAKQVLLRVPLLESAVRMPSKA
ncbi:MAG: rane protein [Bacilli bacterium]|nr:rane protein [Bacilli bacterium]